VRHTKDQTHTGRARNNLSPSPHRASACLLTLVLTLGAVPASAQILGPIGLRGFGAFGQTTFVAKESFDAVLGKNAGPTLGGGVQVLLPWGIFVEAGAWKFEGDGERVFVGPDDEVFRLGIPVAIRVTPLEVTGGWRFRRGPRVVPYGGAGYSSYRYRETSDFAEPGEDVDEKFTGFHVVGGAEYLPFRWVGIGAEVVWSSIADALGKGGVSAAFNEDNLGGTSIRLKISVGR
jgi:opacity protein-like surface antigen